MQKLKGFRTVIFNVVMTIIVVVKAMNPDTELPGEEEVRHAIDALDVAIAGVWGIGSIIFRTITSSPIFKKREKGSATMSLIILLALVSFIGCSAFPVCIDGWPEDAVITKVANRYEKCPQDVGTGILLIAASAINLNKDVPDKAIRFANDVIAYLNDPGALITGEGLIAYLEQQAIQYPGLLEVIDLNYTYLQQMAKYKFLDKFTIHRIADVYLRDRFIPRMELYKKQFEKKAA